MSGRTASLVLFTDSFPFSIFTEEVFIMPELEELSRRFDRVVIVPHRIAGKQIQLPYKNITVDLGMARSLSTRVRPARLIWLLHPWVIRRLPKLLSETRSPSKLLAAAFYLMNTRRSAGQIKRILKRNGMSPDNTLLYSFWFDNVTDSFALLNGYKAVTRAHGSDIFDSQIRHRVRFLRAASLANLSRVFCASENGAHYLAEAYPDYSGKIAVSRLGSETPAAPAPEPDSDNKCLTLLTCARVAPVKRVDRCLKAAAAIAEAFPFSNVRWIHVGDGPLMNRLRAMASKTDSLPANLTIELRGAMPNKELHKLYQSTPVNWFMLLSESEGLPIALTEAISYGVPVIATDVGGNREIVTPDTGVLVSAQFTPEQIVGEIQPYFIDRQSYTMLRSSARQFWTENFSTAELRRKFVDELRAISES